MTRPDTEAHRIYATLKREILANLLPQGHPLGEVDLAHRLGASRTPLREALLRLEADGLVRIEPRRGAFVQQLSVADFLEINELRSILEPYAAGLAAIRINQTEIQALRARLAAIPEIIGLKEASFDTTRTVETIDAARRLPRKLGILTGSDTFIYEAMVMGCDGALIGFAGTATAELCEMHAAVARRDYERANAIWTRLGPLARHCWRAPIRDYRPRMKEVLKLQGLFEHATVREPQLPVDDAERAAIARLVREAGLTANAQLSAVGD